MRLLKVGRDPSCDIVLQSPRASALHAEITVLNNGDILLEDKNSKNGTYIMNMPIQPGKQVNIKRGDAIRFADVELMWSQVPMPEDNSNFKAVYGIGSNLRNEIQISGNTASRFHATLKIDKKDNAYIQDHSKNGTTVNGQKLNQGQKVKIKRGDAIACGGIPINIDPYLPKSNWKKVMTIAASIIVLFAIGGTAWYGFDNGWFGNAFGSTVTPKTAQAMENASACVYGGYYYEITITDDPFKNKIKNWPEKWYLGIRDGKLAVNTTTEGLSPIPYTGTAFFISKEGEMGTNRHIAAPWEYRTQDEEDIIRTLMTKARQTADNEYLLPILQAAYQYGQVSMSDLMAWLDRYQRSPFEISGSHAFFGVGLTGSKINNQIDLQQAQVIAESGDPKKDVALIRLNTRKTPDYIVKMGAIYDIENARVDETSLKPQDETFTIVGYPMGEKVSDMTFDGKELRPTIHKASLSKTPDDNQMQIQAVGIGGQSGSPVMDSKHRLVGVLCSGFSGTEVTYCCNIKHLKELYEKHKVRE